MRHVLPPVLACLLVLGACSPTLNWRELRLTSTPLKALLPCKPDHGSRRMPLAAVEVDMHMAGCEAGGTLFAVAWVDMQDAALAATALTQWQTAMLANMQGTTTQVADFTPKGAGGQPPGVRVVASGRRQDGRVVVAQGVWFARGTQVFHAALYADQPSPDVVETFFAGIELQ